VDRVRRLRKTPAPLPADLAAAEPAGGSVVDRVDAGEPIAEALKELPPPQQDVIRLSFYTGLTHEEIAAKLGLPLGTVKTRIRLGMTRLRDRLSARNKVTDE
jgi:RNA polymerase sigma-70 factor (ECF subfamily)